MRKIRVSDEGPKRAGSEIDWAEAHKRLRKAQATLDQGLMPTVEEKNRILRERARRLARSRRQPVKESPLIEVLEFTLAEERYAIETIYVREVLPLRELTAVPCAPSFVLGITNLRGEVLSIIDLKGFLNLPIKGITELDKVIVLHSPDMEFGMLADTIVGARSIEVAELEQDSPILDSIGAQYLKGVTRERLIVLAAESILSDPRIKVHEEVE